MITLAPRRAGDGMLTQVTRQEEIPRRVDHVAVELLGGHGRPIDADRVMPVIDEDVDLTGVFERGREAVADRFLVGMVDRYAKMFGISDPRQPIGGGLRGIDPATAGDHRRPCFRQRRRHGRAKVARGAGDQGDFPVQAEQLGNGACCGQGSSHVLCRRRRRDGRAGGVVGFLQDRVVLSVARRGRPSAARSAGGRSDCGRSSGSSRSDGSARRPARACRGRPSDSLVRRHLRQPHRVARDADGRCGCVPPVWLPFR
jgi:hypothetical protein